EDGLLAVVELAKEVDPALDLANKVLLQTAGALLAIASDEGDRVAFIEQLHDAFDLHFANLQVLGDARALWRGNRVHWSVHPSRGHPSREKRGCRLRSARQAEPKTRRLVSLH